MVKKTFYIIVIIAIGIALSYLGYKTINKPIKIGAEFNLTGDFSYMGINENKILHFLLSNYFKDLKIDLKVVDNHSTEDGTKKAIEELSKWGAQVIIGGAISKTGVPASIEATKMKIPFLGTTSTSAQLYNKKDYYFTSDYSNNTIAMATGLMLKKFKVNKLMIICTEENKSYSIDMADKIKNFVNYYKLWTIKNEDSIDFAKIRNTVKEDSIDSLLFTTNSRTTAIIAQNLRNNFHELKFFGTGWNSDNDLIKFGGESIDGFKSVSTYPKIPTKEMEDIEGKYIATYNENISDFFVFVYNDLEMLKEAIKNNCKTRNEFYSFFSTPRIYFGVDGKFYINEFGDAARNYNYLLYIKGNVWEETKLYTK